MNTILAFVRLARVPLFELVGVVTIVAGVGRLSAAAGWIVAGLGVLAKSAEWDLRSRKRPE